MNSKRNNTTVKENKTTQDVFANNELKNKKKKKKKKIKKRNFFFGIGIFILIILIVMNVFISKYLPNISEITKEAKIIIENMNEEDFKTTATSHVFDKDNNELFEIKLDKDLEYITYNNIPDNVKNAFIAIEDKRFWKHNGVDFKSLLRAGFSLLKNKGEITQGGSTITQQLVKLTYLTNEQSFVRKYKEMLISRRLEEHFSKEQILEFYANNVYFNNNIYGINTAAKKYFNKNLNELTLSQVAFLAAIPNNPTIYDPYNKKENVIERRNLILEQMYTQEMISEEEYNNAIKEEIKVLDTKQKTSDKGYDTRKDFVIKEFTEILMRKQGFKFEYDFNTYDERDEYIEKYNEVFEETKKQIYKQGYNIYTSFDNDLQREEQEIIDDKFIYAEELSEENIYQLQGASVTIENATGLILSMVGGRTSPSTDYLDRSYNVLRQNGSTMKPIGVYGPAFDLLGYLPSNKKNDANESGGPTNSTGYYGTLSLREAIKVSSNTIAWKVYRDVGPENGMKYLQEMEFSSIVPDDMRLPSGLGGLTLGTNPLEVAGAYATIANNGLFNRPSCIVQIKDINNKVIYSHEVLNKRIYKESTAAMLTDCLIDVFDFGSTVGTRIANNIDSAGKTGTTNDDKDGWFAGFSPKYTTVIWSGYDEPRYVPNLYGRIKAAQTWKDMMDYIHRNDSNLKFDKSDTVVEVWINSNGERVPDGTGIKEIFPISQIPSQNEVAFDDKKKEEFMLKLDKLINSIKQGEEGIESFILKSQELKNEIENSSLSSSGKNELFEQIKNKLNALKDKVEEQHKVEQEIQKPIEEEKPQKPNQPEKPIETPIIPEQPSIETPIIPEQPNNDNLEEETIPEEKPIENEEEHQNVEN